MFDLAAIGYVLVFISALAIGFNKAGLAGSGLVAIIFMATIFPAKQSTGIVLPLLIFADFFAVLFYRRHVRWKVVLRLLPFAVGGIFVGFFSMGRINSAQLRPIIGGVVLAMIALSLFMKFKDIGVSSGNLWFSIFMGVFAGFTSMISNAAGPIMTIYLVSMKSDKMEFVGDRAWFFASVNLIKVPFSASLGLITWQSLGFDALLLPAVLAGAVSGYFLVKVIPQKLFQIIVLALAAVTAINLLIPFF
jgi:hypothetical protein